MTGFLQHLRGMQFPDKITDLQNCWSSSGYLPTVTFLQILIASLIISKEIDNPLTARLFRLAGVSTLLLLSDTKFAALRFEALEMIDDLKHKPAAPERHQPHYWEQDDFLYDDDYQDEICEDFLLDGEDEEYEDEG